MAPLYTMRSMVFWANWPGGVDECNARKSRLLFEKKNVYVTLFTESSSFVIPLSPLHP